MASVRSTPPSADGWPVTTQTQSAKCHVKREIIMLFMIKFSLDYDEPPDYVTPLIALPMKSVQKLSQIVFTLLISELTPISLCAAQYPFQPTPD